MRAFVAPVVSLALIAVLVGCEAKAEWLYQSALKSLVDGDTLAARTAFGRLVFDHPDHERAPEAALHRARILWVHDRQYEAAEVALNDIIRLYPQSAEAKEAVREMIALLSEQEDKKERLLKFAQGYISRFSDQDMEMFLRRTMADVYLGAGNFDQALFELAAIAAAQKTKEEKFSTNLEIAKIHYFAENRETLDALLPRLVTDATELGNEASIAEVKYLWAIHMEEKDNINDALSLLFEIEGSYANPTVISEKIVALQERKEKRKR